MKSSKVIHKKYLPVPLSLNVYCSMYILFIRLFNFDITLSKVFVKSTCSEFVVRIKININNWTLLLFIS